MISITMSSITVMGTTTLVNHHYTEKVIVFSIIFFVIGLMAGTWFTHETNIESRVTEGDN